MMTNRKLPFGYRMEQGQAVIQPQEAEVVTAVFRQYITGASYLDIVDLLKDQPVLYDTGRRWSKSMVARILGDRRYTGEDRFPALLDEETFQRADRKRATKQTPIRRTEAQKVLRQLSGQKVSKNAESQVLALLNSLIRAPDLIQQQPEMTTSQGEIVRLERELEAIMEKQPIDEEAAQNLIRQIAATQYAAIPDGEYETLRLRRVFSQAEPMEKLDAALLKSTVSHIQLAYGGIASLRLKNGQRIERR